MKNLIQSALEGDGLNWGVVTLPMSAESNADRAQFHTSLGVPQEKSTA
jgi:hypothetical protein